jgi:hypothetical protein
MSFAACPNRWSMGAALQGGSVRTLLTLTLLVVAASVQPAACRAAEVLHRCASETLTAVEMNHGDQLQFTLRCGRTVSLVLEDTRAAIVERVEPGGIVYQFCCDVRIDGQPITLRRYVCSQESFYEPYVVSGLRIWPDTVRAVFDLIPVRYPRPGHLQCVPRKAARFAIQDATLRICPEPTHPWLDEPQDYIDVGRCYNGDDCYLGAYLGQACHVGLDINHPAGSLLLAPIRFDTHAYFNSLAAGHNNNRWRGIRRWENGDVWALQTHHLIKLLVPENQPLAIGTKYATTAGVHVGSHEHTHFEFKVGRKHDVDPLHGSDDPASIACPIDFDDQSPAAQENPEVLHLDPWIVFWQTFEDRKARRGDLQASITPLAPVRTGEPVRFTANIHGLNGPRHRLFCYWSFGDGGSGKGMAPVHIYARPGIYPVTLVVDEATCRVSATYHLVVCGEPITEPSVVLDAPDEPSFRIRPASVADVYDWPVPHRPHTLHFVARASRPIPDARYVQAQNAGGGSLGPIFAQVAGAGFWTRWLRVVVAEDDPSRLRVAVDATTLSPGSYSASVSVLCDAAINSPQTFRVELEVREDPPPDGDVTVDDADDGFYATPYFWVGHRFSRVPVARRGYRGFYLTNGGVAAAGEFVRFTPDLRRGRYLVAFHEATPFGPDAKFQVRVRYSSGVDVITVQPSRSRHIGEFEFEEGTDGLVEILAEDSTGLVVADAVVFRWSPVPR